MALLLNELNSCCSMITSSKVTERKRYIDVLYTLLENPDLLQILNKEENSNKWDVLIESVHKYLVREAEKLNNDERKKDKKTVSKPRIEALVLAVSKAKLKCAAKLDCEKLIGIVIDSLDTYILRKYYLEKYLLVLHDYILSDQQYCSKIKQQQWKDLLHTLKELNYLEDSKVLGCIKLLFKWAPIHKLSLFHLRDEFDFVSRLGQNLNDSQSKKYKIEVLEILVDFCRKTSSDCCLACCKLGEDVFISLQSIYQPTTSDIKIKELLFEFLLFQVNLHHPKGALSTDRMAYALSWIQWKKQLSAMYFMIEKEIRHQLRCGSKTSFLTNNARNARLQNIFVSLCTAVFHQVFSWDPSSATQVIDHNDTDVSRAKRQRVEVSLEEIFTCIKETQAWQWIHIVTEYLRKYPASLNNDQFHHLFKIISSILQDSQDQDVIKCCYEALDVLLDVEANITNLTEVANIDRVYESTLRCIGLNHNVEETHRLLRKMLTKGKIKDLDRLYETFSSGVLVLSDHSLYTLKMAANLHNIPETMNNNSFRKTIIEWILNVNVHKCDAPHVYTEQITGEVLVKLCLKKWAEEIEGENTSQKNVYDNFENVYEYNACMKLIALPNKISKTEAEKIFYLNEETYSFLLNQLELIARDSMTKQDHPTHTKDLFKKLCLFAHVLSILERHNLLKNIEDILNKTKFADIFAFLCTKLTNCDELKVKGNIKFYKDFLADLNQFFSIEFSRSVSEMIRNLVSVDILKKFFEIINIDSEDKISATDLGDLKLLSMQILSNFCFYGNCVIFSETQLHILEALTETNYDNNDDFDYKMVITFLTHIQQCTSAIFNDDILGKILNLIQDVCYVRFAEYNAVLNVLSLLKELVKHIVKSKNVNVRKNYITMLCDFYELRTDYGYDVSLAIIECIGNIIEVSLNNGTSLSNDESELFALLPDFLISPYQEVRLHTIRYISLIFNMDSLVDDTIFIIQRELFKAINVKCHEVFRIETNNMSRERSIDETVARSSSVLHTYGSLIVSSSTWRIKLLYFLIQFVFDKKIDTNSLDRILNLIAIELKFVGKDDFLSSYAEYLLDEWNSDDKDMSEFPYKLLGYDSELAFYEKYTHIIIPLSVVKRDTDFLKNICVLLKKTVAEIYELYFSEIFAGIYRFQIKYPNIKISEDIKNTLTNDRVEELLLQNVDKIIVHMTKTILDEKVFEEQFSMPFKLLKYKDDNTLKNFDDMMYQLRKDLDLPVPVFESLINHPGKIQSIMLCLVINIHNKFTAEDRLKALHQYVACVDSITTCIGSNNYHLSRYITRWVIHSLLHFISKDTNNIFSIAACKYLQKYCAEITNNNFQLLSSHLTTIINHLVPFLNMNNDLSAECLKVIRLLVSENADKYKNSIQDLDPFPSFPELADINDVYLELRSEIVNGGLESEIKHFLRAGEFKSNIGSRTDALKHLRDQLSTKKDELRILYEKSKDIKGCTRNSKDVVLHNLIQMLFKLTQSADKEISTEAARCLGELGPLDLASLMLQLGEPHQYPESTPFQLMTSHVVKLLSNYIIDVDIELVKAASDALYGVLQSKEGKYYVDNLEDDSLLCRDYLYPFLSNRRGSVTVIRIDKKEFQENVNRNELWFADGQNHNIWIKNLACQLLKCFSEKCYIHKLIPICKIKVDFCEELLPHIIHLVISDGVPEFVRCLTTQINKFFETVWRHSSQACYDKKTSVQTMLNIIHFLRLNYKKTSQLQLDYLKLAHAAYYCSNFYAAVLYAELWSTQTNTVNPGGCTILEKICETETVDITKTMLNVLKHSYTALGDLDALYGCNFSDNTDPENWLEHFKQLEKWDQVSLDYDVAISNGQANKIPELMNSLKRSGYCYLAANCDNSWSDYECLWRLNKFDNDNIKAKPIDLYEKYKYEGLKQLKEDDRELFTVAIENARQFVIETIRCTSLESITDLYSCLTKLQSIQELEDAERAKRDLNFPFLLEKWKMQDSIDKVDFKSVEPIRAQRISILNIFAGNNYDNLKKPLLKSYLHLAESARTEGYFNVANRSIKTLLDVTQESQKYGYLGIFEEAQICWAMGNKIRAKYLIKHLLKITGDDPRLKFASLKLYGMWMAETRSENPDIILNNYFLESLKLLKGIDLKEKDKQSIFKTYDIIARFADAEYQRILSYIKSAEFERKVKNMEKSKQTAGMIETQSKTLDYDQRKAMTIHKKQSLIDETEIENTYREKNVYWKLAMKYYLISLQNSDISNIRAFRILSLLLENRTLKGPDNLLAECLSKIPSYKFISILPQLAPHLTNNSNDEFGNLIMQIIERCAKDHPHHTLPIILALVNSNKDNIFSKSNAATESNEVRVLGAQAILEKLKQDAPEIKNIIQEMEFVCDALIQFAYTAYESCQDTKKKDTYLIPSNMKILKIKNYSKLLLPTCTLNVRKTCRYNDITGIYSYNKEFGKVGGINNPKRLYCRGTDGVVRSQLLKGKDDLRQDAVMEQVFENINELLRANKQTRHLLIRTYKVVPLSKRSGILEWVEGSIRIGDYLLQAHSEHNPKDWKADACRVAMLQVAKKSSADKLKKFKEICENFKPVFHKFFESNYLEPLVWYDRRKAYMHSVATTSMCGYILGLGDRHLQNILLDEYTAEVIHIDFGIAFEQGRVLPTPETVPFRLTRDIEDGMGMTGIEGIFRKSCERTMEVMRNNHETIITILEVLLYDPLYEWTVSPAEAYSMQICQENDNDNTSRIAGSEEEAVPINVSAERALLRVKQKLHGTEEGGTSSVEGQVEKLLQQARDPSNLSRLYVGWQPFL